MFISSPKNNNFPLKKEEKKPFLALVKLKGNGKKLKQIK